MLRNLPINFKNTRKVSFLIFNNFVLPFKIILFIIFLNDRHFVKGWRMKMANELGLNLGMYYAHIKSHLNRLINAHIIP